MNETALLAAASRLGFADAALIDTDRIVFEPSFRQYCEENRCGNYGANYACPPACGTVEEMRQRVLGYPRALVLRTQWSWTEGEDPGRLVEAKKQHGRMTRDLITQTGCRGLMVGASGCNLCAECLMKKGEPCRYPDQRFSCMSAYCISVEDLARQCGMPYTWRTGTVSFFSMVCLP